jgi:hypothetical protein
MSSNFAPEDTGIAQWWLAEANRDPIGPLTGELLLEWLRGGMVTSDAFVCEVGGGRWRRLGEVARIGQMLPESKRPFDPSRERSVIDLQPLPKEEASSPRTGRAGPSEVTAVAVPRPVASAQRGRPEN